ncbi:mobile mystery protein B [Armatimonas sp.]|uniref:mobile mystery protein B n=1 Tax=Armatimonas sp. TaxID=1872638 RepID=UPI0037503B09
MTFDYPEGATPLDPDTIQGLIPGLTTQGELNEFEARNIASALQWALRSRTLKRDLLTSNGLTRLHERMFNITWRWAGQFRKRETNIGVVPTQIPVALAALCGDVAYQVEHQVFGWDELAVRFHHRLVLIHPFPNGNGRHARLAADLLMHYQGLPMFSWGARSITEGANTGGTLLTQSSDVRSAYLSALRQADRGDFEPLLAFVRT